MNSRLAKAGAKHSLISLPRGGLTFCAKGMKNDGGFFHAGLKRIAVNLNNEALASISILTANLNANAFGGVIH
jgi:hypothetical protein